MPIYQRFINALKTMRLELSTLRQDLEAMLEAIDPLTGIPGRLGLLTKLREQQALAERGLQPCRLAMMDLEKLISKPSTTGSGIRPETWCSSRSRAI